MPRTFAEALSRAPAGAEPVAQWGPPGVGPAQVRAGLGGRAMPTGPDLGTHMGFSYGTQLVEVRVDPRTRAIRVARMVGVFDAGTVVNPRTARSRLLGGLVWGIGHGLLEKTEVGRRLGRFANTDLAGHHVAACADVREITVELLPGRDPVANPLGVKSIGEVGIVGVNAAVANAVFHATGVRVRRAPAMLEDIMGPGT
jgi:xanthine dehydrogenase YagR molybdenum-binding subunit